MPPAAIRVVAEQGSEAVDRSQETNTHHDNSFTAGLHVDVGKADVPTNAMRGNINGAFPLFHSIQFPGRVSFRPYI